jgi:hypothetical protein
MKRERKPSTSWSLVLLAAVGCSGAGLGQNGTATLPGDGESRLGGCQVFPPDNPWNQDISAAPVDPESDRYLAAMNAAHARLFPDFGSEPVYGIPWMVVSNAQRRLPIAFKWPDESDPGPYPFPPNAPIEGGPASKGDRHVIVIDRHACRLYEGINCWFDSPGWRCDAGAVFDLRSNDLRPHGWTSADAAGLPIFPGLVRHEEVMSGEIRHALRFTVRRTQRAFVAPARHYASQDRDPALPPMGLRVRLKAGFDLSSYSGTPKVILVALKRYGMFLADNGSDWYISGESNPAWDNEELRPLREIPASAFEVVKLGEIHR